MDNVVGTLVYAIVTNVEDHQSSKFGLRLAGTAPDVGEMHFVFASDCFGWAFRDGTFDVHEPVACGDRERVCGGLVTEREQLKYDWFNGEKSRAARWVFRLVVRIGIGGAGGRPFLGITPEPPRWSTWAEMVGDRRNFRGLPIDFADANGDATDRSAQRPKPSSVGGELKVYSPRKDIRAPKSSLVSLREAVKKYYSAGPSAEV